MHPLHDEVDALLRQTAEEVILPYFGNLTDHQIEEKAADDYVTVADRLSEEMLEAGLAKILPSASIVGEEAVAANGDVMQRLADDEVWIIDPIDGTGNFADGKPPFGILLALTEANEIIAGWIYDPLRKRMCHAWLGHGAWIDGQTVKTPQDAPDKPVAALATYFMTPEQRAEMTAKGGKHYQLVDIPRCAAEQYPRLVLGTNHLTIFERTLAWDHAAGVLFLNEAGGKAARWDGSPYRPADNKKGMVAATTPYLWEQAISLLS